MQIAFGIKKRAVKQVMSKSHVVYGGSNVCARFILETKMNEAQPLPTKPSRSVEEMQSLGGFWSIPVHVNGRGRWSLSDGEGRGCCISQPPTAGRAVNCNLQSTTMGAWNGPFLRPWECSAQSRGPGTQ